VRARDEAGGGRPVPARSRPRVDAFAESIDRSRGRIRADIAPGLEYHVPTGRCLADRQIVPRRHDVAVEGDEVVVSPASSRRPPAASAP
jgi:hypothetical protein